MKGWSASEWELLIVVGNEVLTLVLAIIMLYMRSIFVTRRQHGELKKRVEGHAERLNLGDGRFDRLEDRIGALPTGSEIADLKVSIERLNGDLRALGRQLEGYEQLHVTLKRQVDVMDEFLRNRPDR